MGCGGCHIPTIRTAAPGTRINGGAIRVRDAVGNKIIHPYSDFLLHDIGTGDGIPVLPGAEFASTATQIRTAPLWALRTRNRLMHDGLSFTKQEAIARHAGQATAVKSGLRRADARHRRTRCWLSSTRFEPSEEALERVGGPRVNGRTRGPPCWAMPATSVVGFVAFELDEAEAVAERIAEADAA